MSPYFAFQGRVYLEAGREDLEFEGGAQMQFDCGGFDTEWIEFKGVINPNGVEIPIESELTEMGKAHLAVGWTHNQGGKTVLYPAFLARNRFVRIIHFSSQKVCCSMT